MSIPFSERNPVVVGAISLAVVAGLILAAFNAQNLPIIGGGDIYYAAFSEAGGLKANDEVRVAGVRVGKVEKVELDGDHVKVTFRIEDAAEFGKETSADIKVKTLLGAMYLSLAPAGSGQLAEGAEIPVTRTSSPYDVVKAFSGLAETSDRIDTDQLAGALTTLADLTRNTPDEFRAALDGVSRLSTNVAAKNSQINELLGNLQNVAEVLDARDQDIIGLMRDSDVLFRALVARRDAVHRPARVDDHALDRADQAGQAEPGRPQARLDPPRHGRRRAEQERGQHRQQPAADGALLPRLREHARQRAVVRHLHPEHATRPAGGLAHGPQEDRRPADRRRPARRGRFTCSRRQGDEDPHRALPANGLDLRGQRRPRSRRADRHRRHRHPVRHRRRRHHVVRRRGQGSRRRRGGHRVAVDRGRPLRAADARLHRGAGPRRRRDAPGRPHRCASGARPDLLRASTT